MASERANKQTYDLAGERLRTAVKLLLLSMSGQTHRIHYVVTDREFCPMVQQQYRQNKQAKTLQ